MDKRSEGVPTLKDVAAAAGLSIAAVSKVFNNREGVSAANRALVTKIAEEMGYAGISGKAAANSRLQRAVIATLDKYVTNDAFYGQIIESILEFSRAENIEINLSIVSSQDLEQADLRHLLKTPSDGIFLVGLDGSAVVNAVRSIGCPAVLVNGMDSHMELSSVSPDNYFGGRDVTRRLMELGHRDIVHITHPHRESLMRRLMGFREAMEGAGLPFSFEQNIFDVGDPDLINLSCHDKVANYLRTRNPRPTALFCANDMVALGVLRAIENVGLQVPDDISVIGFDGLAVGAHASPPISTMAIDGREMALHAVQMLLDIAKSEQHCVRRLSLGVRYIERASTRALDPSS